MNLHKRVQFTYKTRGNLSDAYNFRETTGSQRSQSAMSDQAGDDSTCPTRELR